MNRFKNRLFISIIAIFITVSSVIGFLGYKLYNHEKNQSEKINALNGRISLLEAKNKIKETNGKKISWNKEGYNYLAIGNSITLHGIASYWWSDDRGMAASKTGKDYVHLVQNYLRGNNKIVVGYSLNLAGWEVNSADREEFLPLLDPYLSSNINLITVQLGENASNLETYKADFEVLIKYIQNKAPNAQILVVGDFWTKADRDVLKEQAAKSCGVVYVSLEGIKDNKKYYAGVGSSVDGADGVRHTINHVGVAAHPGDLGMKAIAERIICFIN